MELDLEHLPCEERLGLLQPGAEMALRGGLRAAPSACGDIFKEVELGSSQQCRAGR